MSAAAVVYPVFFQNSAKKLILVGCHPLESVTRGAVPHPLPHSDAICVVLGLYD